MTASLNVFGNVFEYDTNADVFGNVFELDAATTASPNVFGNVFKYDTNADVFGNVFEWDAATTAVVSEVPQVASAVPQFGGGGGGGGLGRLPWMRTPVVTTGDDEELALLIPLMMKVIINGNSR
jgi:hypothetical protein